MDEIEELRKLVGVLASKIDDLERKIKGETLTLEEFVKNQPDVFKMPLRSTASMIGVSVNTLRKQIAVLEANGVIRSTKVTPKQIEYTKVVSDDTIEECEVLEVVPNSMMMMKPFGGNNQIIKDVIRLVGGREGYKLTQYDSNIILSESFNNNIAHKEIILLDTNIWDADQIVNYIRDTKVISENGLQSEGSVVIIKRYALDDYQLTVELINMHNPGVDSSLTYIESPYSLSISSETIFRDVKYDKEGNEIDFNNEEHYYSVFKELVEEKLNRVIDIEYKLL